MVSIFDDLRARLVFGGFEQGQKLRAEHLREEGTALEAALCAAVHGHLGHHSGQEGAAQ